MKHYEILESFAYQKFTPEGLVEGEFHPGVTGDDLSDEQLAVLESVPAELARCVDGPAPVATTQPEPAPAPTADAVAPATEPEAQPEQEMSA